MNVKKNLLCLITTLFAIFIGPNITILLLIGAYYVCIAIVYVVINMIYESRYMICRRKAKQMQILVNVALKDKLLEVIKLHDWLNKEGFILRVKDNGSLYLQNKTTKIDYYHSFNVKLFITALEKGNEEYLIYEDDEMLKDRLEKYLDFLTRKYRELIERDYALMGSNRSIIKSNRSHGINSHIFWDICIRIQGYVFLAIGLISISEENFPNIFKFTTFVTYLLIETYEKRAQEVS